MLLVIRHFFDRKRPAIVLEEGNKCLLIGYLTDKRREEWLRKMTGIEDKSYSIGIRIDATCSLDELLESID